ncbi:MAG TPA: deoxyribose-phosphate aldolase [Bryobacteraceae bacterium]|jgi:deoxyribose-phosphate aldolase|nr:deoxyribose-phosphate aldolase [Bryobacteraceae bacterium]
MTAAPEDLAAVLDLTLLDPDLDDERVVAGIQEARRYGVASVTVRPCDIDLAVRSLQGSAARAGAVCGFPHGSQNTTVKLYEARDLLRRGARDIAVVIGISRLLSREFQHVQTELSQLAESCHAERGRLTVILEAGYLTDELKVIACACCERAEVDFVAPATGFGPAIDVAAELSFLRRRLPEEIGLQAGGIHSLDEALALREAGCSRIGTATPGAILDEWKARQAATQQS